MDKTLVRNMIFSSLFTAMYILGTLIRIPFPVIPLVLTNLFLVIGGAILGPLWGSISVLMYFLLGIIGIPVFSGGGGIAVFLGPTGGYLIGYITCVLIIGVFRNITKGQIAGYIVGSFLGLLSIYCIGVPWLKIVINADWIKSFTVGMWPFLLGDAIKLSLAITILIYIQKYTPQFLLNLHTENSN